MAKHQTITPSYILKKFLYYGQRFLVYPSAFVPQPRYLVTPSDYDLPYDDINIQTSDKVTLRCYLIECEDPQATVMMFHGNAMDHSSLLYQAKQFHDLDCNVLTVSYRGFGDSEGVPSEKGLQKDAQATLYYILNHERLSKLPIIVYGVSLGGAVAIDVTSKNADKISALIIENTFTSIPEIVRQWPIIGLISFTCTQRWNSSSKISLIPPTLPIMFCSGRNDRVVPPVHMDNLWKLAKERGKRPGKRRGRLRIFPGTSKGGEKTEKTENWAPPKNDKFIEFPSGGHSDTYMRPVYWSCIKSFIRRCLSSRA